VVVLRGGVRTVGYNKTPKGMIMLYYTAFIVFLWTKAHKNSKDNQPTSTHLM